MRMFAVAMCGAALALPAAAQTPRYSSGWGDPAQPAGQGAARANTADERLLEELKRLTDEAERVRAADPRFLSDLRDLARRYEWPWRRRIAFDEFRDGDYARDPVWTVEAGSFAVGYEGLVSRQDASRAQPAQPAQQGQAGDKQDLGRALMGALVQELARERPASGPSQPAATPPATESRIRLNAATPNAFAVVVALRASAAAGGGIEFGLGRGAAGEGYRLAYNPGGGGATPSLALVRAGPYGSAVIDVVNAPPALQDGAAHTLQLTRDAAGDLTIGLDGKELLRARDRTVREPFDRLLLINRGGEYAIRSVALYGTP